MPDAASLSTLSEIREQVEHQAEAERQQYAPKKNPLIPEETLVSRFLVSEPPLPEPLILYNDQPFLIRGIVGMLAAAGGAGKSFFALQLCYHLSEGTRFGLLSPPQDSHLRVLYINAEDPLSELNRRLWLKGRGDFPDTFHVASVAGKAGPLMELERGTPIRSDWFTWLRESIARHEGLDLLVLDTLSRFYGLDENSNDHAAQWIASLEALAVEFEISILFLHHVNKGAENRAVSQSMARGASAFIFNSRFGLGLEPLREDAARRFGIRNRRQYVTVENLKNNYAPELAAPMHFKKGVGGLLETVDLKRDRDHELATAIVDLLAGQQREYSVNELAREKSGSFLNSLKDSFEGFNRKVDVGPAVSFALEAGWIEEVAAHGSRGKVKKILRVMTAR